MSTLIRIISTDSRNSAAYDILFTRTAAKTLPFLVLAVEGFIVTTVGFADFNIGVLRG